MTSHPYRIYSNVSKEEYILLRTICRQYGFRSIYQLIQTLIHTYLRYAKTEEYEEEPYSLSKEVEDMFDEMMEEQERIKSYQTDRMHK